MIRKPGWESRLSQYMREKDDSVFEWGTNDCALFVAGAIEILTGEDIASSVRGTYTTEYGAAKAIKDAGFDNLESLVNDWLGGSISTTYAEAGDVVSYEVLGSPALGVCTGTDAVFLREGEGLILLPMVMMDKAWRV